MINIQYLHNQAAQNFSYHNMIGENELWWKLISNGETVFGNSWEPLGKLETQVNDLFLASDGYVYIVFATKIYRTLDFINFELMSFSGGVPTKLGSICEISGNRLLTGDYVGLYVKDIGPSTTFSYVGPADMIEPFQNFTGAKINGHPSSPYIAQLGSFTSLKWYGSMKIRNTTNFSLVANISGNRTGIGYGCYVETKPLLANDGSWIGTFGAPTPSTGSTVRFDPNTLNGSVVTPYGFKQGCLTKDKNGRLILRFDTHFLTSNNNGVNWSYNVATNLTIYSAMYVGANRIVFCKRGTSPTFNISYTDDDFNTIVDVLTLTEDQAICYCLLANKQIVLGSYGPTHNLYISRS